MKQLLLMKKRQVAPWAGKTFNKFIEIYIKNLVRRTFMKKLTLLGLILFSFIMVGCEEDSGSGDSSSKVKLTDEDVAGLASLGTTMGQSMSDLAIGYDSTPPSLAFKRRDLGERSGPRSATSSVSNYNFNSSTNYWDLSETLDYSGSGSSLVYTYNMSIGLWEGGSLQETISSNLEKVTMYGAYSFYMSDDESGEEVTINMTMGNGIADPFTWDGINTSEVTLDGSFIFDIIVDNQSISMAMTFTDLTIERNGSNTYPEGTMSISVVAGSDSFTGTIVYNGSSTAVATINGNTTNIDLSSAALVENLSFLR